MKPAIPAMVTPGTNKNSTRKRKIPIRIKTIMAVSDIRGRIS
jgi:hypothetical protein